MNMKRQALVPLVAFLLVAGGLRSPAADGRFAGQFFRGTGDAEYLRLLDTARRMFEPDPEFQNLAMLYMPSWNGLVEGPTWDAWWIQNSYGTTYASLPFLREPFVTFLANSHDLWFSQMGDGKRLGASPPFNWVAPDGALCDAARPGYIIYKQGDGRIQIHDWGMEFTAAGLLMQAELLLISRDARALGHYLPKLERCANFIESRRDRTNNLFLVGPAGNLLAPSYAGWKKPDGTYGMAYLTGLSVTYIAALDRLIELEKLAGRPAQASLHQERRDAARKGLAALATDEGYFIRSLDPDGTRHGVFGAPKHGYFETSPNHDAVAFRVVDEAQAERIYAKMASIPGLRPHQFIIPNYPSYDDLYEKPEGLWAFGTWVNGGHWSTCEARMMLGYYRLGRFEDARRSMLALLGFAEQFRMDNPLVGFGSAPYQPGQPVNLTYDAFGPPAGFLRGLFEYLYRADSLTLVPHIPPGLTRLEQRFPVRFGSKRIYLSSVGTGNISAVTLNGKPWPSHDRQTVTLTYDQLPPVAAIEIALGAGKLAGFEPPALVQTPPPIPPNDAVWQRLQKTNLATNNLPFRIGADSFGSSRFLGDIARARLFGRALTADEIATLARSREAVLAGEQSCLGDWDFGQLENRELASGAGARLPARVVGECELVETPGGKAVRLKGKGYLEVANHPTLNLIESCTMEAWIRPDQQSPGGGRILDKSEVGTSNGYLLDTHPGNSLRLIAQVGTVSFDARLVPGQWVHVAATVSPNGRLALYLSGKLVAEKRGSPMPDVTSLLATAGRWGRFHALLAADGQTDTYEAAHCRLVMECLAAAHTRLSWLAGGRLKPLANPISQSAADESYLDTVRKLSDGLAQVLAAGEKSTAPEKRRLAELWKQAQ
jgi:hypothetical protein